METASAAEAPAPAPVITFEAFRSLCNTPPLQACSECWVAQTRALLGLLFNMRAVNDCMSQQSS